MNQIITIWLDRILWKWWIGKDSDNQEAFEDLVDTIIFNKDDMNIAPWKASTMQEFSFEISSNKLEDLNTAKNDLSLEDYINGCLRYFRAEEEKIKNLFS
ncbi:hypothetical protein [Desulfitibacter alkalitolerans]|uniref:hypothetical protein n=1 Tax=Desulfitibacter alkalitolerans TaxID=264641 RepID=UPI0004805354|nr:hypothetical protein [Desulfitibacter alkalitolerans]